MENRRERTKVASPNTQRATEVSADGEISPTVPARSVPDPLREDRYLALLEHPTDFIVVFEAVRTERGAVRDWRYVDVNRNILRLLSTTREHLLGKYLSEVAPDRAERLIPMYARVLETGVSETYESTYGNTDF